MVELTDLVKGDRIIFTGDFKVSLGPEISKGTKARVRYIDKEPSYIIESAGVRLSPYCWVDLENGKSVYLNQKQNPPINKI